MCNVICNFNLDNLYLISVNIMVSKREGMFVKCKIVIENDDKFNKNQIRRVRYSTKINWEKMEGKKENGWTA